MRRNIYRYLGFLFLLSLAIPLSASAQVVINEIMYDPSGADSGREWVEVFNSSTSSVDLSTWKFLESASASNHGLTTIQGTASLLAGGFAVIVIDSAKFQADWPSFTGNILKASFSSLNNTGATITLKDGSGNVVSQVTYASTQGGSGDGASLQRQSGESWLAATPTPGSANSSVTSSANSTTTDQLTETTSNTSTYSYPTPSSPVVSSAHYSFVPLSNKKNEAALSLSAGRDRVGSVGSPLEFKADVNFSYTRNGNFTWNFGDGTQQAGEVVTHVYEYPGEYIVMLNVDFPEGKGVARTNVKIIDPQISIVGADQMRVQIKNNSSQEVNMYGRGILFVGQVYLFPRDTIIKAGQVLSLSSKATNLRPFTQNDVQLIVIGETEQPKIKEKIETAKKEQIAQIEAKIAQLKTQMVYAYAGSIPKSAPGAVGTGTATVIPKETTFSSPSVAAVSKSGWWETFRKFFLGSKLKDKK